MSVSMRQYHEKLQKNTLQMGADMCYSEELIDKKVLTCKRHVNSEYGTVDFICDKSPYPVFCTVPGEPVVFQSNVAQQSLPNSLCAVGTASATTALQAAQVICGDVKAIDVNMGCPQHFSIHAG